MLLIGFECELKVDCLAQSVCNRVETSVALALVDLCLAAVNRRGDLGIYPVALELSVMLLGGIDVCCLVEILFLEDVVDSPGESE